MDQIDVNAFEQFVPQRVGCAYFGNTERARLLFNYLCPEGFEVYSVAPSRTNKKPYCQWTVIYRFTGNRPYLSGAAARLAINTLLRDQPSNAYALTKSRYEGSQDVPPSWKIEYGVRCTRQKDFRMPLTQSVSDVLNQCDLSEVFKIELME